MSNPLNPFFAELDGVLHELSSWVDNNKLSIERRQVIAQTCDLLTRAQLVLAETVNVQLQWLQIDPGVYGTTEEDNGTDSETEDQAGQT